MESGDPKNNVNWGRFGLGNEQGPRARRHSGGFVDLGNEYEYAAGGHQASGANELFAEEQGDVPWWRSNFFISQPVLFGKWDGVFTSCLINIFGVIVFLRSGWIVGQAGVLCALLIILATVFIALISVLSAVGICERCRVESGGVYFLIAHVLGSRFGGSLGLLYCFGQAVGCALNVLGFGESMASLLGLAESKLAERTIASAAVLLLSVINVAGVKWVIKLQFLLLLILLLAALDFMVGSFVHTDIANGFEGWLSDNFMSNMMPHYTGGYSWFTVFGVFFPTVTGILSGINMSGDLRAPSTDIPTGTLAAIGTGTFLYCVWALFLGATCTRSALLDDYFISARVSAVRVLLIAGLYVSSMSSCLGAMYGTPRVLQSIAGENVIPGIGSLHRGRGPNRVPLYALGVVAVVTLTFVFVGEINTLAPIVTMPFLLTYACIDYAYFALAQTSDLRHQREQRFRRPQQQTESPSNDTHVADFDNDYLDTLFPERTSTQQPASPQHDPTRRYHPSGQPIDPDDPDAEGPQLRIHSKTNHWYSALCNRWFSLAGTVTKLVIMFLVHWWYAAACIVAVFLVWLYVGTANPAVKPGVASQFNFFRWLRNCLLRCLGRRTSDYEQIVVTPAHPRLSLTASQLNEENEDFASRRRYHQSATITTPLIQL